MLAIPAAARRWLQRFYWQTIFAIDRIVAASVRVPAGDDIVFIRHDGLGDFVLWIAAAKGLRAQWPWPGHRFVLVANAAWSDFACDLAIFDEVIAVSPWRFHDDLLYRFRMVARLARISADLAVSLRSSPRPMDEDSIARAIGARRRISPNGDATHSHPFASNVGSRWYDELISLPAPGAHETEINRAFLQQAFGIALPQGWPHVPADRTGDLPAALTGIDYVLIAPGATDTKKVWSGEKFAAIANRIAERAGLRIVLSGTGAERDQIAHVAAHCTTPPIDLSGALSLKQMMRVMAGAKLIVSNDTGVVHLGAAMRIPSLAITGGGGFKRFGDYPPEAAASGVLYDAVHRRMPCYECNWRCIYPIAPGMPAPCMRDIEVDDAWRAAERLLRQSGTTLR